MIASQHNQDISIHAFNFDSNPFDLGGDHFTDFDNDFEDDEDFDNDQPW